VAAKLAEAGLLVRHWPTEHGGSGDKDWWNYAIQVEENWAHWEPRGPQYMNTSWIGPAVIQFGTEQQKQRFLPPIRAGAVVWCQGFSEPNAGSNLSAMRTAATPVEGGYVINGSKIWTSYSPYADNIFLLARTGPARREISCFLLSMQSKGITVRQNPGVSAEGHLNEVFFTDVFAPRDSLLGEENHGWKIVAEVMDYERVGVPFYHMIGEVLNVVVAQLKAAGRFNDPFVRAQAGRIKASLEAARQMAYQVMDERAKNKPSSAIAQLARSGNVNAGRMLINFILQQVGPDIDRMDASIESFFRFAMTEGHGAGAHEVVLNAIAERHLNLPKG
jgi:alkylation response protein AidB-like acyl-CoA dehydrogenase